MPSYWRPGASSARHSRGLFAILCCLFLFGCSAPIARPDTGPALLFKKSRVRTFTDSYWAQAVADGGPWVAVATRTGVLRWNTQTGKYALLATNPKKAPRFSAIAIDKNQVIWAAGSEELVRIEGERIEHLSRPPVGPFVSALIAFDDDRLWAAGPEGIARLSRGVWETALADTAITALALGPSGLWIGTSGRGVLRIGRSGDRIEHFGPLQGCETDVVRGLAINEQGLVIVGEGPNGPRMAFFNGERFFSYRLDQAQPPSWAARAGSELAIGSQSSYFTLRLDGNGKAGDPAVIRPATSPTTNLDPEVLPFSTAATGAAFDHAPVPTKPANGEGKFPPPPIELIPGPAALPEGLTSVGNSSAGLLVGTRFLGVERIENGVPRPLRAANLLHGAKRLFVACTSAASDECFVATGGPRAYRFDGETFDPAAIDSEQGSSILAVLRDPRNQVVAVHRGAHDRLLRISVVSEGRWTPVTFSPIEVPAGIPEVTFARFSPNGHLWMGLSYVDQDGDERPYGAVELELEFGQVRYHGRTHATAQLPIPDDVTAMHFLSAEDAWLATRSGVGHLTGANLKMFTENEGLASEFLRDIAPGPSGEIWVASKSGTGRYDGNRWIFPKLGAFFPPSTSLVSDGRGQVFIGTDRGVYCQGSCDSQAIDMKSGLLDNAVLDLDVDLRGRVWVLTRNGLTIIDP